MSFAQEIVELLEEAGDPERAPRMMDYMRGQFEFYGVSAPSRKAVCKEHFIISKHLDHDDLIEQVDLLWQEDARECQHAAVDILIINKKRLLPADMDHLHNWTVQKSWWDTVDFLASHMVGTLVKKYPQLEKQYIQPWLTSDNMWLNRTCLIYQLKYAHDTDFEKQKSYIRLLTHDQEFFVQKAIGWSLRQYSKIEPMLVQSFVKEVGLKGLAKREALKYVDTTL